MTYKTLANFKIKQPQLVIFDDKNDSDDTEIRQDIVSLADRKTRLVFDCEVSTANEVKAFAYVWEIVRDYLAKSGRKLAQERFDAWDCETDAITLKNLEDAQNWYKDDDDHVDFYADYGINVDVEIFDESCYICISLMSEKEANENRVAEQPAEYKAAAESEKLTTEKVGSASKAFTDELSRYYVTRYIYSKSDNYTLFTNKATKSFINLKDAVRYARIYSRSGLHSQTYISLSDGEIIYRFYPKNQEYKEENYTFPEYLDFRGRKKLIQRSNSVNTYTLSHSLYVDESDRYIYFSVNLNSCSNERKGFAYLWALVGEYLEMYDLSYVKRIYKDWSRPLLGNFPCWRAVFFDAKDKFSYYHDYAFLQKRFSETGGTIFPYVYCDIFTKGRAFQIISIKFYKKILL